MTYLLVTDCLQVFNLNVITIDSPKCLKGDTLISGSTWVVGMIYESILVYQYMFKRFDKVNFQLIQVLRWSSIRFYVHEF